MELLSNLRIVISLKNSEDGSDKAKLQKEGIFFLIHLFARDILFMKKLRSKRTMTTLYSTFKTDMIKLGLVVRISNFLITKTSLANKWMRKKNTVLL